MGRVVKAPEERRIELLDTGIQLFIDNGIESTSIKDIVNKAGVATGLFYYYFSSKEVFIEEAINRFALKYIDSLITILISEELSPAEQLLRALSDFETHLKKVTLYWGINTFTPTQHHVFETTIISKIKPIMESVIKRGVEEGVFNVIDPSVAATFFLHGLSGVLHMKLDNENFSDYTATIEQIVLSALGTQITIKE